MESVILVIHLIVSVSIIAVVLLQKSEGGGLGIGSSGGMGAMATPRSTADFLTRLTGVLAASFMVTSLTLAVLSGAKRTDSGSILDVDTSELEQSVPVAGAVDVSVDSKDAKEMATDALNVAVEDKKKEISNKVDAGVPVSK